MDIFEINSIRPRKMPSEAMLSPMWRLQDLCIDITLLQRQLGLVLKDEGAIAGETALRLAAARGIGDRLVEGHALFRNLGVETAAITAFRRHLDRPDAIAHRLRRGEAPAGMVREVLFAAGLFLTAAQQRLAAASPRHEPQTSAAYDRFEDEDDEVLARIA